jgi:hypothetical protein
MQALPGHILMHPIKVLTYSDHASFRKTHNVLDAAVFHPVRSCCHPPSTLQDVQLQYSYCFKQ